MPSPSREARAAYMRQYRHINKQREKTRRAKQLSEEECNSRDLLAQARANERQRLCLSGLGKPHTFLSQHAGVRICPRCRKRQGKWVEPSPRAEPYRVACETPS